MSGVLLRRGISGKVVEVWTRFVVRRIIGVSVGVLVLIGVGVIKVLMLEEVEWRVGGT